MQGVAIAFKCGATKAQFDSTVSTKVTILTWLLGPVLKLD